MNKIAGWFFKRLFLNEPKLKTNQERLTAFTELHNTCIEGRLEQRIPYTLPHPKFEFVSYLTSNFGYLCHGSNRSDLTVLEPREQSEYRGRKINAVFSTSDAIWSIFFAVLDLDNYQGSLRNACFVISDRTGAASRYYFFSINKDPKNTHTWTDGMLYILPSSSFRQTSTGSIRFDEWASGEPVNPVMKIAVGPEDFPFLDAVSRHNDQELIYKTWLLYKYRIKNK